MIEAVDTGVTVIGVLQEKDLTKAGKLRKWVASVVGGLKYIYEMMRTINDPKNTLEITRQLIDEHYGETGTYIGKPDVMEEMNRSIARLRRDLSS